MADRRTSSISRTIQGAGFVGRDGETGGATRRTSQGEARAGRARQKLTSEKRARSVALFGKGVATPSDSKVQPGRRVPRRSSVGSK